MAKIVIVGGGVMGLFAAERLTDPSRAAESGNTREGAELIVLEPGHDARTAGLAAAAFISPDHAATGVERRRQRASLEYYACAQNDPTLGIAWGPARKLSRAPIFPTSGETKLAASKLRQDYFGVESPMFRINPPVFFEAMKDRLEKRGVTFIPVLAPNPQAVYDQFGADVIVNTTGMGASEFVGDNTLVPIRGHSARIRLPDAPQIVQFVEEDPAIRTWYVAAGKNEVRIGGSFEEGCWDLEPDKDIVNKMFKRVQAMLPFHIDPWANTIEIRCGLRPARKGGMRLELEMMDNLKVVHCYGNGGGGFTTGPGCGLEVRQLVLQALETN